MDSTHPVLIETDFYSMHSRSKFHYLMILNWEKYLWHLKIVFSYFLRVTLRTQQTIMKIIRIVIWFNRFFTNLRKSWNIKNKGIIWHLFIVPTYGTKREHVEQWWCYYHCDDHPRLYLVFLWEQHLDTVPTFHNYNAI